ncbi:MAG: GNAT family N-acetyltransferase, partial [Chloroflexota bacterium]
EAGLYEAADLQWWWREDNAPIADRQTFWCDINGVPLACFLRFDAGPTWENDFFYLPSLEVETRNLLWSQVIDTITGLDKASTLTVRDDDRYFRESLEQANFQLDPVALIQTQLLGDPPKSAFPDGFRLQSRAQNEPLPHHLIPRNGPQVAQRLKQCSLYNADLDLVIRDRNDVVAAYGLFWMDPVTRVGLIEPLRTEQSFQRLGLAQSLVAAGIKRLKQAGADTIRISYKENNQPAARLYYNLGFRDMVRKLTYRRSDRA